MPDDLYERDILRWSEREVDLLRRLSRGERVNDAVDWPHVIGELADVGVSELRGVRSLLQQALAHLVKLHAEPHAESARHWQGEIAVFLGTAQDQCAASMRGRIDLDKLWRLTLRQSRLAYPALSLPAECPWTLDELLAEEPEIAALAARLAA